MAEVELVDGYKLVIANKLDKFLKENKVTNKEFGAALGVTEGAVRRWRTGLGAMDINQIIKLCEYWNITLYELLDIKDPLNLTDADIERLRKLKEYPELATVIDNYKK